MKGLTCMSKEKAVVSRRSNDHGGMREGWIARVGLVI
jgi:hypothetical protein